MNKTQHLNYIILHDGKDYALFERLGKKVPFDAYNKEKALMVSDSVDEILKISRTENLKNFRIKNPKNSEIKKPKNQGSQINFPKIFEIEHRPYEVMYNE